MNAMDLLKQDHEKVKKILGELDSTTERGVKTREELFTKFKQEMTVHERIEEEIFYPRLTEQAKTKEIALEGYEEHHVVDMVMSELDEVPYDDEHWGAKFTVMKENIEHHIEEEEGEMFKLARQALDKDELEELGERMEARKNELKEASGRLRERRADDYESDGAPADALLAEVRKTRETADRLANGDYPEGADHIRALAGMVKQLADQMERLADLSLERGASGTNDRPEDGSGESGQELLP